MACVAVLARLAYDPKRITLPARHQCARLLAFTGLDLFFAGSALYILMPAGTDIDFAVLIAAFVLALGMGLISNIPAVAGVLEISIVAFVAPQDMAPVLAALCGFRVVGYLTPAAIAILWLAIQRRTRPVSPPQSAGEWDLARQSAQLVRSGDAIWLRANPCGLPITIGAGSAPSRPPRLKAGCYKLNAETAVCLRKAGWSVNKIAIEAMIAPQTWVIDGKCKATLRRKIRQAKQHDVYIEHATTPLPIPAMTAIAAQWSKRNGGELGFSMGRFDPDYIADQEVFLIWQSTRLIGFVTFQNHGTSWHLDLMRQSDAAPSGAMHLAIATAIDTARQKNVAQLSLAAIHDCKLSDHVLTRLDGQADGLKRFKNSFGPIWRPLYHAAPNRFLAIITLGVVTLAVQRPWRRLWH